MTAVDRFRVAAAFVMAALGLIIVVRAISAEALSVAIVGMLLLALGLYRLNQVRRFRSRSRPH